MDFYNDIELFACQWMRNLIDAGELPQGEVCEKSIRDITAKELEVRAIVPQVAAVFVRAFMEECLGQ